MKILRVFVGGCFGLLGLGCGNNMTMMSDYSTDLNQHVDAVRAEQTSHSEEIATAADLDAIGRAETGHWQRNNDHMTKMDEVMGNMMSCTDVRGNPFDHAGFAGMMQDMRSECDQHRDKMRDLPDLETRRAEEARHEDAMKTWLDQMHTKVGTMMSGAGRMTSCHS